ncbi:type 1 fimbrial protein [Salmonella enterica]|uniref:Type 1 fimbrial protein n=6 Tax=Salmonella enterica TaxID=28901 RepID=A0A702LD36_SALHO|nr:type 1 fimbrial protein [Salmonella enterica subsp. houtenae]EAA7390288.1 type 1 fimbrial protein [Salmonella enterica subsp. enterica]EAB2654643.1 type 1 fimbrial protein [Salmonella enterica]EDX1434601.1 type 1 fimbrial protein [Salmonella enterica subsp. houtenae serovar 44:z4,z24:-]EEH1859022.1 type 1 fimbrial protein [Salmonella enterica subsp. houtenae serovar 50:g,z51:-]EHB8802444.1 type 1 fimbrial protein [Salmonella enterica subsp. enterica serovar Rough O:z4,z23:-]ESE83487.1 hypo
MSVIKKNIPGVGLCICAFFIHSAVGQQTAQGGVIHFRGAIVEPLCDAYTHAENIDLTCLREGKKQVHRIDLRQASGLPQDIQSIATVRLHYLNAQKSLAVMNIEYR